MSVSLPPFQRLLDAHAGEVHRFLVSAAGRDDADDCFQETFLAALRAWPSLRSTENLRGWLFTIAARKALDAHRARGRRAVPVADVPEPEASPLPEGCDELWDAVAELPPKQRAAVVQRFVLDLPHAAIASALGCSEEAARRNVHEGLKRLRTVVSR